MSRLYEMGEVKHSHVFDYKFMNPFTKLSKSHKSLTMGYRYGYSQLIYILCAVISLLLIGFLSSDINKTFILISLLIYYIFLYYNLSCYLIPDNHERCFVLAWICIISILFITLIVLFHRNIFRSPNKTDKTKGGRHCKKYKKHKGSGNCKSEEKGGGNCKS